MDINSSDKTIVLRCYPDRSESGHQLYIGTSVANMIRAPLTR